MIQSWDRFRLRRLMRRHPGLDIDPLASSNFASAHFDLAPGATLRIEAHVVTERIALGVAFRIGPGATVVIGEGSWIRCELQPVNLVAIEGGSLEIGQRCVVNGCHLSAKTLVRLGEGAGVGPGSRVFDADQHPMDDETPERSEPVLIGDWVWVAADVTVLRGVEIGAHSVIRTRSLVSRSIPAHTVAHGIPAKARGRVSDRKRWLDGDPPQR